MCIYTVRVNQIHVNFSLNLSYWCNFENAQAQKVLLNSYIVLHKVICRQQFFKPFVLTALCLKAQLGYL